MNASVRLVLYLAGDARRVRYERKINSSEVPGLVLNPDSATHGCTTSSLRASRPSLAKASAMPYSGTIRSPALGTKPFSPPLSSHE